MKQHVPASAIKFFFKPGTYFISCLFIFLADIRMTSHFRIAVFCDLNKPG